MAVQPGLALPPFQSLSTLSHLPLCSRSTCCFPASPFLWPCQDLGLQGQLRNPGPVGLLALPQQVYRVIQVPLWQSLLRRQPTSLGG